MLLVFIENKYVFTLWIYFPQCTALVYITWNDEIKIREQLSIFAQNDICHVKKLYTKIEV